MTAPIQNLSEQELAELIASATQELDAKRHGKRKEVIAEMKALAASIGMAVEITEAEAKGAPGKRSKVAVKYRDPGDS